MTWAIDMLAEEIATTVDFQVSVCDPREEYKSAWRTPGARSCAEPSHEKGGRWRPQEDEESGG